ncbi:hypothetical protein B0A52_03849 [Exophiala mesophila]|uniref:Wax synthase domain-containing protein n=1 Tax=Exophiala mesophila TaxID=212818 RepID=A0A438N7X3_EXOME|nr:hypothetical protein B0A52_03849 [Exophiala mesophila]
MTSLELDPPPYEARFQDYLPHITLPFLAILSFTCPPFAGRGILFATLIAINYFAFYFSPWPPNVYETRNMRYGMTSVWLFVLPIFERLLLHVPERDFWQLEDAGPIENRHPPPWTWQKVHWAISLAATPRGVGWNFGGRRVNAARLALKEAGKGRAASVRDSLIQTIIAYLALDATIILAKSAPIPAGWRFNLPTIADIVVAELYMFAAVYFAMGLQYSFVATVAVGFGLSPPENWVPVFGSFSDCYTISNVWGKFWHTYIRQPVLGISHTITETFRIPPRSIIAYLVHLTTAFTISAFFHIISLDSIRSDKVSLQELTRDMLIFFMAQPIGTLAEALVIDYYRRCGSDEGMPDAGRGVIFGYYAGLASPDGGSPKATLPSERGTGQCQSPSGDPYSEERL